MSSPDLSSFCKRISIKASEQEVYDAWTSQDELEQWFLRKAEFTKPDGSLRKRKESIQKGDSFYWLWHGYDDNAFERKSVIEANGENLFQFLFTGDCLVTVRTKTEQGETICELTQERIPPNDDFSNHLYHLCGEGWVFYITNLKSYLEGGIDLRNKNVALGNMVS